jgi:predicted small lipoprotein YifL
MILRSVPVVALALALLAGCGGDAPLEPPNASPAAYSGALEESAEGRVLVREDGDACGIWLAPADGVDVLRAEGDGYAAASWDDLAAGQAVDVWISGPIAESCPMQADADAVVIRAG